MSLGSKLQAAHERVNVKLGRQDDSVTFRQQAEVENAKFGRPHTSVSNTDVVITEGLKVMRAIARDVDVAGTVRVGDLKLQVPGSLIEEAELKATDVILYATNQYAMVLYAPMEIYSGEVVRWQVFARLKE